MNQPSVSVVVVNWNGEQLLSECLDALHRTHYSPLELIVDNASTDKSMEVLNRYSGIRVIRSERNLGFAAVNNRAVAQASGHYIALVNNDVIVEPEWLAAAIEAMGTDERIGVVGCRLMNATRPHITDVLYHRVGRNLMFDVVGGGAPLHR